MSLKVFFFAYYKQLCYSIGIPLGKQRKKITLKLPKMLHFKTGAQSNLIQWKKTQNLALISTCLFSSRLKNFEPITYNWKWKHILQRVFYLWKGKKRISIIDSLGVPTRPLKDQCPIMLSGVQTQNKKLCPNPKHPWEDNRRNAWVR